MDPAYRNTCSLHIRWPVALVTGPEITKRIRVEMKSLISHHLLQLFNALGANGLNLFGRRNLKTEYKVTILKKKGAFFVSLAEFLIQRGQLPAQPAVGDHQIP